MKIDKNTVKFCIEKFVIMKKRNSLLTKLRGRKINNTFWLGNLVCNSPKKHIILHSKYRSTMSDDLFEHILTILSGK